MIQKIFIFSVILLLSLGCKEPRIPNLDNPFGNINSGSKDSTATGNNTSGTSSNPTNPVVNNQNLIGTFECVITSKFLKYSNQVIRLSISKVKDSKIQLRFYGYCINTEDIDIEANLDTPTSFVIDNENVEGEKITGKGYFNSTNELEINISSKTLTFRMFKVSDVVNFRFAPTTIDRFYPEYVFAGEELVILGKNFYQTMKVYFDDIPGEITFMNKEVVKIKIPDLKKESLSVKYTDGFCSTVQAPKPLKFRKNRWFEAKDFAGLSRWYALGFGDDENGYLGFGMDANRIRFDDLWQFNLSTNSWSKMPPFIGPARNAPVSFRIKDKVYIGTGYFNSSLKDFYEFDLIKKTWRRIPDLATAREHATAFSVNGKGYVVGGKSLGDGWKKDLWEYDPEKDTWTRKKDIPGDGRGFMTTMVFGDKVLLGGGIGEANRWLDEWYLYDPKTDSWTLKTRYPTTFDPLGFVVDNLGYVIYDSNKRMVAYDLESDIWREITIPKELSLSHPTFFQVGKRIFFGTGHNGSQTVTKMWEYVE